LFAGAAAAAYIGLYWNCVGRLPAISRSTIMGKLRQSNKEAKKQAVHTPKEKKAAKRAKKHQSDTTPLIPH
jgi:hypothetical protein